MSLTGLYDPFVNESNRFHGLSIINSILANLTNMLSQLTLL